jgi:hypothetical protein
VRPIRHHSADRRGRFVSPARSAGQPLGPPVCRPLPPRARVAPRHWRVDPTCQLPLPRNGAREIFAARTAPTSRGEDSGDLGVRVTVALLHVLKTTPHHPEPLTAFSSPRTQKHRRQGRTPPPLSNQRRRRAGIGAPGRGTSPRLRGAVCYLHRGRQPPGERRFLAEALGSAALCGQSSASR